MMALEALIAINGIIKDEKMVEVKCYEKIVKAVCHLVFLEIKQDDLHVQRKLYMCKVNMLNEVFSSFKIWLEFISSNFNLVKIIDHLDDFLQMNIL